MNDTAITSLSQMLSLLTNAQNNRTKLATKLSQSSSRSHLIITFNIKLRKSIETGGHKISSKVAFIDLAGSGKSMKDQTRYILIESLIKKRNK